jgi:protein arginine N-methyltransferase 1
MISDIHRMNFYYQIITSNIEKNDVVLDVGTGTGVLACWAEKAGASSVIAIDHSDISLKMADTLAKANNCKNIQLMCGHSSQFNLEDNQPKVDVILHEQIGDILFDECMVSTISDLRERVLKPNGKIIPSKFYLFIEPVQISSNRRVSMMQNLKSHGLDFSCLQSLVKDQNEDPNYYHFRSSDPSIVDFFLTKPQPILEIDLHTIKDPLNDKVLKCRKNVNKAGRLDALVVYFSCYDTTANAEITSGPFNHRCAHWGFRLLRLSEKMVHLNEELNVTVNISNSSGSWENLQSWRWSVTKTGDPEPVEDDVGGVCDAGSGGSGGGVQFISMEELNKLRQ